MNDRLRELTAQDVFLALIAELDHPQGYITKDPVTLDSLTVDGVISCEAIAKFLNQRLASFETPSSETNTPAPYMDTAHKSLNDVLPPRDEPWRLKKSAFSPPSSRK